MKLPYLKRLFRSFSKNLSYLVATVFLISQCLNLLNLGTIKAQAGAPGPFWTWSGSGAPTKIVGSENFDKILVGGVPWEAPARNYYIALEGSNVYTWGANDVKQLGNTNTTNTTTPALVPALSGLTQVGTGWSSNVGLKSDGTLIYWGNGSNPTPVPGASGITKIDFNANGGIALGSGGQVFNVAYNGSYINTIAGTPVATEVVQGWNTKFVIDTTGKVWAWGSNSYGQLGDGTTIDNNAPTIVSGLPQIQAISVGQEHVLALDINGDVWSWGRNLETETGQPYSTSTNSPQKVAGLPAIKEIISSGFSSKAIDFSQKIWEWGQSKTGGTSPSPGTLPNPANLSQPMLADSGTLFTNGVTTVAKRDLLFIPDLKITKTSSAPSVVQGGNTTFAISYLNSGNATATNVVIDDLLQTQFGFSSCTGSCVNTGQSISWAIGSVTAGSSGSVSVSVSVPLNAAVGPVVNTATIDSDQSTPTSATSSVSITPAPVPGLYISKSASVITATRSDSFNYTLSYNNITGAAVDNVVITDQLDSRLSLNSLDPSCSQSGQTITCNISSLASNTSGSFNIGVGVNSDAAAGPLANTVVIVSDQTILEPRSGSSLIDITVPDPTGPTMSLFKTITNGSSFNVGDTINYSIQVTNNKNNYQNINLYDVLDPRLNYNNDCNFSCFTSNTSNTVELDFSIGVNANSTETITYSAQVKTEAAPGDLWNTAIANYYDGQNNSASSSVVATINDNGQGGTLNGKITLSKVANFNQRKAGDSLQYTITTTYNGPSKTLYFKDNLDARLTNISCDNGCNINGQSLDWSQFFSDGQTSVVLVNVSVASGSAMGSLTNTVIADDQDTGSAPEPKSATSVIQITSPINPQLSVSKTVSKTVAQAGDALVYSINYANTGDVDLNNVIIADNLDSRLSFVSAPGCLNSGQLVSCNIGTLSVGSTGTVLVTVTVNNTAASGILPNTVIATSDQSAATSTVTYSRIDIPKPTLGISILKTANVTTAQVGSQVVYTLAYANTGNIDLSGAVLTDTLDSRLSFASCSSSCNVSGQLVTWNLGGLLNGANSSVTLTVNIKSGAAPGTLINTALFDTNETAPVSSSSNVTLTPASWNPLTITKTASNQNQNRNSTFTYTISYSNPNPNPAMNAEITDNLDSRLDFVSSPDCTAVAQLITCSLGNLSANASSTTTITVKVKNTAAYGMLTNTAQISSTDTGPSLAVALVFINPISAVAAPSLTKTASVLQALRGDTYVYTINYSNSTDQNFSNVVISDTLDNNLNFISCTTGCNQVGQGLTWNIGNLIIGGSGSVSVSVSVKNNATLGLLTNSALITTTEAPTVQASSFVAVIINDPLPMANLTLNKTASSQTLNRGDTYSYTLSYTNGPVAVTNATITDTLNNNLNFVSCSVSCLQIGQNLTWNLGNLAPNATGSVTVTVQVKPDAALGNVNNTATISSTQTAIYTSTAGVSIIINTGTPTLKVTKTASNSTRAPGESLTYTINYENTANLPVTGTVITDTLDNRLTFVSCTGGCTRIGQNLTWNLGNIADKALGSVSVVVTISNTATTSLLNNTALFDSNETAAASSLVAVAIIESPQPSLNISQIASSTSLRPGDTYSYNLSYLNGNLPVTNATLATTLDSRLDFVSCTASCVNTGQNVNWNLGNLNASDVGGITLTVKVKDSAAVGSLDSLVTIDSIETAPIPSTERVAIIVDPQAPYLKVDGVASPSKARRGDTVTFTINYENPSSSALTGAILTVPVNSGSFTYLSNNNQVSNLSSNNISYQSCTSGCVFSSGNITWNLGNLAVGQTGSVTFSVQVKNTSPTGLVEAGLNLNSTQTSPAVGKAGLAIVEDIQPRIDLTSNASNSTLTPGSSFSYNIAYQNSGAAVTNAVVSTVLDSNLNFVGCSSGCTQSGQTLTWNLGNLAANQSGIVTVNVGVKITAPIGALNNTSSIVSTETPTPVNALTTVAVVNNALASGDPRLDISVTSTESFIERGRLYSYQIDYQNTSGQVITESYIKNTLDKRLKLFNCFECTQNGSTLNWELGTLAVNQSGSLTYQVQVQEDATIGILTNIAIFGSNQVRPAGNSASVVITPTGTPVQIVRTGGYDGPLNSNPNTASKIPWGTILYVLTGSIFLVICAIIEILYILGKRQKQQS
ncbi:MAG: hypothetical protein WCK98_00320 [bacterium]